MKHSPDIDPLLGVEVAGYRVERSLGRGAMGAVYFARRGTDGVPCVLKFMHPHCAANPRLQKRFTREGQVLARLRPHPRVVRVYAAGEDGERPYIAMEYVPGVSLLRALQERGWLPVAEAARAVRDAALGLAHIHDQGLVHRDVKPANLILVPDGSVKVVDFGVAKDLQRSSLTQPGALVGTAPYVAPEVWEGNKADAACDVFALGVTLYQLLVGELPFKGEDLGDLSDNIVGGRYVPIRSRFPAVPADLEWIVMQMLERERRHRYARIAEVASDLELLAAGRPVPLPSLQASWGERYPLLGPRFFVIGSGPDCAVRLQVPTLSSQHAQVRREPTGYVLNDLEGSNGTWVGQERVEERALIDGDQVRLGEATLTFCDPRGRPAPEPQPGARVEVPGVVLDALVDHGDRRAVLAMLEVLAPCQLDPTLVRLLGAETAEAARGLADQRAQQRRPATAGHLATLSGRPSTLDPESWLAWWEEVATSLPPQRTSRATSRARLVTRAGEPEAVTRTLETRPLRVGRGEGCDLRLTNKSVSRVHASVARFDRRFVVRDEGGRTGVALGGRTVKVGFLDPGAPLVLGEVELLLEVDPEPRTQRGCAVVSLESYLALEALRHPSVCTALVSFLSASDSWIPEVARAALPEDPQAAQRLVGVLQVRFAERVEMARQLLPSLLGQDLGADLAGWQRLLGAARLPLQVLPDWGPTA